jgi:nitrate reductase NapE component
VKGKEIVMASFCAKCGAEGSSDRQFCAACGAPAAAGSAVAGSVQPAAPPARSGSSAVKIILIVVAIFVGLGILGAGAFGFMVWRVARAVHVSGNGDQMTMSTPGGTVNLNATATYSAADLGTDIYPGAEPVKGGMKMSLPTGAMVTGIFLTTDSKHQVVDFYKGKLGSAASVMDTQDAAIITLGRGQQESVMVTITSKASQNDGKTKIAIIHTTNTKPS